MPVQPQMPQQTAGPRQRSVARRSSASIGAGFGGLADGEASSSPASTSAGAAAPTRRQSPAPPMARPASPWLRRLTPSSGQMTWGFMLSYLMFMLVLPIAALLAKSSTMPLALFWERATQPVALHAYWVTFSMAFIAAIFNAIFGFILAWVLVKYKFPGKAWLDAAVDLPFALPTSVAGLTLATVYRCARRLCMPYPSAGFSSTQPMQAPPLPPALAASQLLQQQHASPVSAAVASGRPVSTRVLWHTSTAAPEPAYLPLPAEHSDEGFIGHYLTQMGINIVFTKLGVAIAMIFVSFPFVVRTMQPVIQVHPCVPVVPPRSAAARQLRSMLRSLPLHACTVLAPRPRPCCASALLHAGI